MTNSASNKSFSLNLNGRSVTVEPRDCGVHTTLLDLLRERGLTGQRKDAPKASAAHAPW